jgi:hypothetical protein
VATSHNKSNDQAVNAQPNGAGHISFDLREVDSALVPVVYRHTTDFPAVIDRLIELGHGKTLSFELPPDLKVPYVQSSLANVAIRRGVSVRTRCLSGVIYVTLSDLPRRTNLSATKARNIEIVRLRNAGETLESIGRRYSISRQAVDQVLVRKFSEMPFGSGRTDAAKEFIQPYMARIDEKFCPMCSNKVEARIQLICGACRLAIKRANRIRNLLNCWRNGDHHSLAQAIHEIRKYNIKPEHIAPKETL